MTFAEYEERLFLILAFYPELNQQTALSRCYTALGLNGEAGEVAEKIKKHLRDGLKVEAKYRHDILTELGDVLWYVMACAREHGWSLDDVAKRNIEKLESRHARNTLSGDGDDR